MVMQVNTTKNFRRSDRGINNLPRLELLLVDVTLELESDCIIKGSKVLSVQGSRGAGGMREMRENNQLPIPQSLVPNPQSLIPISEKA